jgi:hypothetical protein
MANLHVAVEDLEEARVSLAMIPFFPAEPAVQSRVMVELARMCPHRRALQWVVATALAKCKTWPGVGELRGILCVRFAPADGVPAECSLPGLTASDGEARYVAQVSARPEQKRLSGEISVAEDPELLASLSRIRAKLEARKRVMGAVVS